ncbi:uncharacterized protein LOC130629098 [Hydractinia symbiolongicarpus]|uniref:uncharacterized protein LOC130629098 n=1 Tax=Hydractinia symbiolongicarpus TaxID=13093 RepID=UPI002550DE10|nr:uncharacterized protein LOC130629098 [Hydractinia symbiolongicarpus]
MSNTELFPIISLSYLAFEYVSGRKNKDQFHSDPTIISLAKEIKNAFMEWGFVYFVDHGIGKDVIQKAFETSKAFFELDSTVKQNFKWYNDNKENFGWVPFKIETVENTRPFDLKECFNFLPDTVREYEINQRLPTFMRSQRALLCSCQLLSEFILRLITLALPVGDMDFLNTKHTFKDPELNASIARLLYYPPIKSKENVLENQLRCGEHSDYGTFTFLFQDKVGGLQVLSPSGDYVDATPVPDSVVVNIGDLLEIWSGGKFKSTRHRVVVPDDNTESARQSIVYFVHPDNNVMVSCLNGSNKNVAVNSLEYLLDKYKQTYA